jgi:branched-subunit amino acid transport protein
VSWGWPALGILVAGSYALKAAGLVALARRRLPARVEELLGLLPAALFGSLVVVSTFGDGQSLVIDARLAGLAAASIALWRRASFAFVVVAAAVATAAVRAVS